MKKQNKSLSTKGKIRAFTSAVLPRLEAILGPLFERHPYWMLAFHEAIGLYGYYMASKQEEVNEFVDFIKSHPKEFRREIVESEEFKDGFVLFFQDYLKIRIKEKKKIAQNIIIRFARSEDKEGFELERLDDALLKISPKSLEILAFFKNEMLPIKEKAIKEKWKERNVDAVYKNYKNKDLWLTIDWKKDPLSRFTQKWLYDNFNPNSEKIKSKYGVIGTWDVDLQNKAFEEERAESEKIYMATDELVQLGIMKLLVFGGGTIGGGAAGADYDFSAFGYEFMRYVDNKEE